MVRACPVSRSPFSSRTLSEHLLRGALALALALVALRFGGLSALVVPAAAVGAVALMRGCPTCWLVGLLGTISDRRAARAAASRDGAADRGRAGGAAPAE